MTNTGDLPLPSGFPDCKGCAYFLTGTPALCGDCAAQTILPLAATHCEVCSQTLTAPGMACRNIICGWSDDRRFFTRVDAIALFGGPLESAIKRLKYDGRRGWAMIFGRLLVGWLENHEREVADIDLIIGNPTARDRAPIQHIEAIMEAAWRENTLHWPIADPDDPVLVKTRSTPSSAGGTWSAKMEAAREHADALELLADVKGKRILLLDDVFTTGAQMARVGRYLRREGGAEEVRGLVLARVPYASP